MDGETWSVAAGIYTRRYNLSSLLDLNPFFLLFLLYNVMLDQPVMEKESSLSALNTVWLKLPRRV